MEVTPLISVVVPVYNVEKWLKRCVKSICNQTYQNLEIILVDDGSSDHSGKLCDEMELEDGRIQVIHKKNGGLSDARNAGLQYATGEYIGFIDSDDWIEPRFYEFLLQTMQGEQCDVVGCKYRKCLEGELTGTVPEKFTVANYERVGAMKGLIENAIQQVVWNKLYKHSLIKDVFFEKGKYHEDEFWSYQIFGRIQRYAEISYIGYNYFQRADSIMGENYSLKRLDAVEAKEYRQRYLEKTMPELATEGRVNLVFSCLYHGQLILQQLSISERKMALDSLKKTIQSNQLEKKDFKVISISQRMWLKLSQKFFVTTCRLRNLCGVGM